MILALAGRRIDSNDSVIKRFPESSVPVLKQSLKKFFIDNKVTHLVSSGACGADLVAQQIAGEIGIERTMLLPFSAESFRNTSVIDRPGNWGEIYDVILKELDEQNLKVLNFDIQDVDAYNKTNDELLNLVIKQSDIKAEDKLVACLWDGYCKAEGDATLDFKLKALDLGLVVEEFNTLTGLPMPNISEPLRKRLRARGTKRILALDGGGVKGAITLGFLGEIERHLADRFDKASLIKKEHFRLYHYFDLIGGTSTGSIIAALLAIKGFSVAEIKAMYLNLSSKIFSRRRGFKIFGKYIYLKRKFDSAPLQEELQKIFGDARLGDTTNKTGFVAITKRLDTSSTWPVSNNPDAKYFVENRFHVKEIVRASTAAPSYFEPEEIDVGDGGKGIFVDGGMSIMNNPSLQLFLMATLEGFNLKWKQGDNNIFIVSIGTGRRDKKLIGEKYKDPKLWDIAKFAPEQFMSDAGEAVEMMMHNLGKGVTPLRKIDSEIGTLEQDSIMSQKACSYARYNIDLTKQALLDIGIKDLNEKHIANLIEMDRPENIQTLLRIGEAAGKFFVKAQHFESQFDLHP